MKAEFVISFMSNTKY